MKPVLLIDFGSTYTKVTAVDLDEEAILGTAASYTTIETDINDGLNKALTILEEKTGKLAGKQYADEKAYAQKFQFHRNLPRNMNDFFKQHIHAVNQDHAEYHFGSNQSSQSCT